MPDMLMTVLEAHVDEAHWTALVERFQQMDAQLPPQLVESFLVQSASDPALWRAVTLWRSREALEEYRRSVQIPGGVELFRAFGAEPTLSRFEVRHHQGQ